MYMHTLQVYPVRVLMASRFAAGVLVLAALLSPACGDPELGVVAPELHPPAANFAILANAAVTCTSGNFTGDVGTFLPAPTGAVTLTSCPVTGTVHVGDAVAAQTFSRFLSTYAALTPQQGEVCTVLTGTLSGVTLVPGTYCFDAAATLTGELTLNGPANGIWAFKIGTSGTGALTGTNFSMVMAGGGQACNVTWWVAQAATMTTSAFKGNLLAGAAVTVTGGSFNGNAWARADATNTGTIFTGCGANNLVPLAVHIGPTRRSWGLL